MKKNKIKFILIYITITTIMAKILYDYFSNGIFHNLKSNEHNILMIVFGFFYILFFGQIFKFIYSHYYSHGYEYNKDQHGHRRFATAKEVEKQYPKIPKEGNYFSKGGIVIGWDTGKRNIYVDPDPANNLIIGTSRSGKGETFVFPTLDGYSRNYKYEKSKEKIEVDHKILVKNILKIDFYNYIEVLKKLGELNDSLNKTITENENTRTKEGIHITEKMNKERVHVKELHLLKKKYLEEKVDLISSFRFPKIPIEVSTKGLSLNNLKIIDQIYEEYSNNNKLPEIFITLTEVDQKKKIENYLESVLKTDVNTFNLDSFQRSIKKEKFCSQEIGLSKITDNSKQPSLIISDPKGELCEHMYSTLIKRGYEVKILNVLDPDYSMSYNPLSIPLKYFSIGEEDACESLLLTLANQLFPIPKGDTIWAKSAQALFVSVALALIEDNYKENKEKVTIYNVFQFTSELGGEVDEEGITDLHKYFKKKPSSSRSKTNFGAVRISKGNTLSSIFASTMVDLSVYISGKPAKMMSKNDMDLEEIGFGKKPIAIFMIIPDYDSSLHAIPVLFISQVYYALGKKISTLNQGGCDREVVFMLDEFGNLPKLNNCASILSVCLGRNIRFNLILQDYKQLDKIYGNDDAQTIKANCQNHLYIKSNNKATAEEYSSLLGNYTMEEISKSGKSMERKSINISYKEKALMSPTSLYELKFGEMILIRILKTKDLKGKGIINFPIGNFNTKKYGKERKGLLPRYEYIQFEDVQNTYSLFRNKNITISHQNMDLEENLYFPKDYIHVHDYEEKLQDNSDMQISQRRIKKIEKLFIENKLVTEERLLEIERSVSNKRLYVKELENFLEENYSSSLINEETYEIIKTQFEFIL